ncbi:MAG: DNA methyltransferase, partial [Sandarakinorhabdus sp.]
MQRLGWDIIKQRAKDFAADWADAAYEKGETQSFYNDFFAIFGVKRRAVASYEKRVTTLEKSRSGFIDLFWPGMLLVEQKSAGLDLGKALGQALDYVDWLPPRDQPRYLLTCDFQRWRLIDLESGSETRFTLPELHTHIERFDFILGRQRTFVTQADVNIQAAELMGKLHDALKAKGYAGHDLEKLLVRLLFCLFADDTGIFEPKDIFLQLIENDTRDDGSDVGRVLNELFDVLDTERRQTGTPAELDAFPYVNGALFAGSVRTPVFDKAMRDMLLDAARFDWRKVSPAIFGSLFQSVLSAKERREKGAHYTSEVNILRVIRPLFLDDLESELAACLARRTGRETALQNFQHKLARLNFLDPACGCGNFLVIAYREIRRLELECLEALHPKATSGVNIGTRQGVLDPSLLSLVDVNQFHGIEYEEWPARIAEVAMWMADHIANIELAAAFSVPFVRIPLKKSANIVHGDALEVDWANVCPREKLSFIMGNPPFVGAKFQTAAQREQVRRIAGLGGSGGTLDYVAAWFLKAVAFAGRSQIRVAFVATNSICQGEQVAQLWPLVFRAGWEIAFAHRSFVWNSEARGKAHVHCVIVGLAHGDVVPAEKRLFSYAEGKGEPTEHRYNWVTA